MRLTVHWLLAESNLRRRRKHFFRTFKNSGYFVVTQVSFWSFSLVFLTQRVAILLTPYGYHYLNNWFLTFYFIRLFKLSCMVSIKLYKLLIIYSQLSKLESLNSANKKLLKTGSVLTVLSSYKCDKKSFLSIHTCCSYKSLKVSIF